MRPTSPFLPLPVEVELGELPLGYARQLGGNSDSENKTHVEVPEGRPEEEEKAVVVPLMENCGDWARMAVPLEVIWTTLTWKPLPVGQPEAGPLTMVEPSAVETLFFRMTFTLGEMFYRDRQCVNSAGNR